MKYSKETIKAVATQIENYLYCSINEEEGLSDFVVWCEDNDLEDEEWFASLVEEVAPIVHDLVFNHLNLED